MFQDPTQLFVIIHNYSTVEKLHNFHQALYLLVHPTKDKSTHVENTTDNTNNNNNNDKN